MSRVFILVCVLIAFALNARPSLAQPSESDFGRATVSGLKFPESDDYQGEPVKTRVSALTRLSTAGGYTDLLKYVVAAPDQLEAGSCLYMSLTGVAELLYAKLKGQASPLKGDGDFSERWIMNMASESHYLKGVKRWRTDSIRIFNNLGHAVLDRDYRFAAGYFVDGDDGYEKSYAGAPDVEYGTQYSWIDERFSIPSTAKKVPLPTFTRKILYADPEENQWNVGIIHPKMVGEIKAALLQYRAPVHVIYNHFGYWHAAMIVGFNDNAETKKCDFTESSRRYLKGLPQDPNKILSPEERNALEQRRIRFEDVSEKLENSVARHGACNSKGIFYVRDSIYGDDKQPEYIYDPSEPKNGKGHYSAPIVELEYNFVTHFGNHLVVIGAEEYHFETNVSGP